MSACLIRKLEKHGREIARMGSAEHKELVPLVEVSLAIMRLACEKFFVLISVLATYLLFRDEAPRPARLIIRLNHRLSVLFQRVSALRTTPSCLMSPCTLEPINQTAGWSALAGLGSWPDWDMAGSAAM